MDLRVYNKRISNVFSLYGTDENSATYAIGYALTKSPTFTCKFLQDVGNLSFDEQQLSLNLQKSSASDTGFTDIEIKCNEHFHLIIEAKRNWQIPLSEQLIKYRSRFSENTKANIMLTISSATQEFAKRHPYDLGQNIQVTHRSWNDVVQIAASARSATRSLHEKIWLAELNNHLKGYVVMQNNKSNEVVVFSISKKAVKPSSNYSWIDIVKDGHYFHPTKPPYPKEPPNYIGFRWDGKIQSVHHIDSYELTPDPEKKDKRWINSPLPHIVYSLGPPMKPQKIVKSGRSMRNTICKCAIDTLLSGAFSTLQEAVDETKKRTKSKSF